jgi:hypothetical protein
LSTHSILAPSDSARWLRCVGSLYMSKGLTQLDAEYSASGSCTHWLAEWALTHPGNDLDIWLGQEMTFGVNPPFKFVVDEDRLDRVRAYVAGVNREPGILLVEQRLDTTPVLGVPDQEGHSDSIKLYPEGGVVKDGQLLRGVLSIHDLKDGHLIVHARDNTQLMIYLCAAMIQYDVTGEYNALRGCIHQPKLNHYDEWTWSRAELLAFMDAIRPVAKLAYDLYHGKIKFDEVQHLQAGEDQCQWCPVRGRCPARTRYIIELFQPIIAKHEINEKILSAILAIAPQVRDALSDYEEEALRRAQCGAKIPGQKLVLGHKGPRRWSDPKSAETYLTLVLPDDKAYAPREIISPTQAEKLLKDAYKPLANMVTQSEGKPRLVPEDDSREELKLEQFGTVPESLV